jgi:hypothetical protein
MESLLQRHAAERRINLYYSSGVTDALVVEICEVTIQEIYNLLITSLDKLTPVSLELLASDLEEILTLLNDSGRVRRLKSVRPLSKILTNAKNEIYIAIDIFHHSHTRNRRYYGILSRCQDYLAMALDYLEITAHLTTEYNKYLASKEDTSQISDKYHLIDLIERYKRRLQILEGQNALSGLFVEPRIVIEIEDIKAKIAKIQEQLGRAM